VFILSSYFVLVSTINNLAQFCPGYQLVMASILLNKNDVTDEAVSSLRDLTMRSMMESLQKRN
jgi:hypothetical protein